MQAKRSRVQIARPNPLSSVQTIHGCRPSPHVAFEHPSARDHLQLDSSTKGTLLLRPMPWFSISALRLTLTRKRTRTRESTEHCARDVRSARARVRVRTADVSTIRASEGECRSAVYEAEGSLVVC